jgi:hypothetical protein
MEQSGDGQFLVCDSPSKDSRYFWCWLDMAVATILGCKMNGQKEVRNDKFVEYHDDWANKANLKHELKVVGR